MKMKHGMIAAVFIGLVSGTCAAPATLVQSVTYNSETITMRLTKENLRGANFELWSQNASGTYDVVTAVAERSYMGTVDGYPGAVSCGVLQDDGQFRGAVYFDRGVTWFTLGTNVVETRALDYGTFSSFQVPGAPTVQAGQAGSTTYGYELGIDADYNYFTDAGSVAKAFEGIEYSVCLVRAIYMRDVLLRPYLGRVIIRSTLAHDPYTGLTQGSYLDAVRLEWNNNHTDTDPDLVCGCSPSKIGGGLAWVGVVGTGSGYSVNQSNSSGNFDVVFRHEMGHNWGCGHFVGGSPEGAGLMGGNAPGRWSGCEAYRVFNHRDNRLASGGILDNEGTYTAIELPPYASMDVGTFVQTLTPSLTMDVLANDHDANGQALSLAAFDGTSAKGGTVTQQGQNLVYTAPGAYLGTDYFMYTVTDTAGRTASGVAIISVEPNDALRLYLPLDETSGTTTADYSVFENDGSVSTNLSAVSVAGVFGNAVDLDGIDDYIEVSNVKLNANTVTLTAWIRPAATQNSFSGIVFDRSNSASGLNIHSDGKLRYHWNDSASSYNWNSGLTPPTDAWTFVALVVEPSRATMYMNSGTSFQMAVNNTSHAAATFGTTFIGRDPTSASRSYDGAIDDVRIYDYAMSQAQLQNLFMGGGAESPLPLDGATDVASSVLRWSAGASAVSNEIYIGTSEAAVNAATKTSPEYKGATVDAFFKAALSDTTTYYWRIDTVTSTATLAGSTWSFTTGTLSSTTDRILINFKQNSNQTFSGGELIGPTSDDSSYWNAVEGASGTQGGLINNSDIPTGVTISWDSSNLWSNGDGTSDDEHKLSTGYLDDGNSGSGKGVTVTLSDIPYAEYKVYGLFATDQNSSGSSGTINFNVNGDWSLGGNSSTTAAAWGSINANHTANGEYWTEIDPGTTQGNYWVVETSGASCTIVGEPRSGSNRGCLTAVIIEDMGGSYTTNAPTWNSNPVIKADAFAMVPYSGSLESDVTDLDGDTLSFTKGYGPAWLNIAEDGTLSGTPSGPDAGLNSWTVNVTDNITPPVEAVLHITVGTAANVANYSFELPGTVKQTNWESVPGWSSDSVASDSGVETGASATDGSWAGYLMSSDPAVWNLTDEFIAAGEVYTLRLAARNSGAGSSLRIKLYYDNGGTRTVLATLDAALSGTAQEFVLNYDSDDEPAAVGHNIGVELDNVAGGWVGFDNIRLTRTGAPDTDGDTMPDWWEIAKGLNPLVDDRAENPDLDMYDNGSEYITDTNPQDGNSQQTFTIERDPETGEPVIRFSTSAIRRYAVEMRDDLTSGDWADISPLLDGTGSEISGPVPSDGPHRYYRLRVELP